MTLPSGHNAMDAAQKSILLLRAHNAGQIAWFFDLDGTLIHAEPGKNAGIAADPELTGMLNHLTARAGGAVSVITGRPRIFVESLLPHRNYPCGVEHGAILQNAAHGAWNRRSPLDKDTLAKIRAVLEDRIRGIKGAQVEDYKEGTLTLEFTKAAQPEKLADELEAVIKEWLAQQSGLAVDVLKAAVPGNYVIELLPTGMGKASAVDVLMADAPFAGKIPVFCGDSKGDEGAMLRVKALGGIAIGIGPKAPPCHDIHFENVAAMRAFVARAAGYPAPRP